MSGITRASLFGKLSPTAYRTIEGATQFCKLRGNPYVELSHWLHQLLEHGECDVAQILSHADVDRARLASDLVRSLDRLPRGATAISDLSMHVEVSVERGWVQASLRFGRARVRTGHLLVGWLETPTLSNALSAISRELTKLSLDDVLKNFDRWTESSTEQREDEAAAAVGGGADADGGSAPRAAGDAGALERFTVDLVAQAKDGDPIVGRDAEIRQLIEVLTRRRQNNPILTGAAGVGKTAVVEGFAQRIARGDVPPSLAGVQLRSLDIALLRAGASMKGEFEQRLKQLIDAVQGSPTPIILFADETHTLVGSGGADAGDAANLLKPALARGGLRTIGATTWAEYKKHIESDPALTRRFQVVSVDEPDPETATAMLRATASRLESHHRVQLRDSALAAAVRLSRRFIPDRQLPDKAVSLLDTACSRVAISQHALPPEVQNARNALSALETEREIVERERFVGAPNPERQSEIESAIEAAGERVKEVESQWQREKGVVDDILRLRSELRRSADGQPDGDVEPPEQAAKLQKLRELGDQLVELQGERPMVLPTVDEQAIAAVVSEWTGVPLGKMKQSEVENVLDLASRLEGRVIGQRHALEVIERRVQTARAGLDDPQKPVGVFLLAGPSGVGKTETALALGDALYGGEDHVITVNMSEFQEAHSVSTLRGAPPGYVGYGEGGVLTEAVRRRPHSVVLLDEIEKAHSDVHEVFFQVFDKGRMEDGQGVRVDFSNTLIVLTSNVGSDAILELCAAGRPEPEAVNDALRPELLRTLPAALVGRMVVVPYYPLGDSVLGDIVRLRLRRLSDRLESRYGVPLDYDDSVVDAVLKRCTEVESGGRVIDAYLTNSLLPEVSRELLLRTLSGRAIEKVTARAPEGTLQVTFD